MGRTGTLPEMEEFVDKKLSELAGDYHKIMIRRVKLNKEESTLKDKVIERMHELKINHYHDADELLTIALSVSKERLQIKYDQNGDGEDN